MSPRLLILYCGMLSAIGAFSTDILLPVFGNMERAFATSMTNIQLTFPVYVFALALGQFLVGPLSDRFGRRPLILCGMGLYVSGGVIALLYPSVAILLFARAVQGLGASVGQVVSRAMLRDRYRGRQLAKAMSWTFFVFAAGPILAPLIGGLFSFGGMWRPCFVFMALFGAVLLFTGLFRLDETLTHKNPDALKPAVIRANLRQFFSDRTSKYFLLVTVTAMVSLYSYLANSARIYKNLFAVEGLEFAVLFAIPGLGILIGQAVNGLALTRYGIIACMRTGAAVIFACSLAVCVFVLSDLLTPFVLTALMFAFNSSFLVVYTNCAALIIDRHPAIAGFASSVFGITTLATVTLIIAVTIPVIAGGVFKWGILMSLSTGACLFMLLRVKAREHA